MKKFKGMLKIILKVWDWRTRKFFKILTKFIWSLKLHHQIVKLHCLGEETNLVSSRFGETSVQRTDTKEKPCGKARKAKQHEKNQPRPQTMSLCTFRRIQKSRYYERLEHWGGSLKKRWHWHLSFGNLIIVESPLIFIDYKKKKKKKNTKNKYKLHE